MHIHIWLHTRDVYKLLTCIRVVLDHLPWIVLYNVYSSISFNIYNIPHWCDPQQFQTRLHYCSRIDIAVYTGLQYCSRIDIAVYTGLQYCSLIDIAVYMLHGRLQWAYFTNQDELASEQCDNSKTFNILLKKYSSAYMNTKFSYVTF